MYLKVANVLPNVPADETVDACIVVVHFDMLHDSDSMVFDCVSHKTNTHNIITFVTSLGKSTI